MTTPTQQPDTEPLRDALRFLQGECGQIAADALQAYEDGGAGDMARALKAIAERLGSIYMAEPVLAAHRALAGTGGAVEPARLTVVEAMNRPDVYAGKKHIMFTTSNRTRTVQRFRYHNGEWQTLGEGGFVTFTCLRTRDMFERATLVDPESP